jgi:hypothetical protein
MKPTKSLGSPKSLDHFEGALLQELKFVVTERAATGAATPLASRHTKARTGWRVAVAAAAAAAVAVTAQLGFGGASPAFAVSTESDGDVVVVIKRLEDAEGLEAALAAKGIQANVTYGDGSGISFEGPLDNDVLDGDVSLPDGPVAGELEDDEVLDEMEDYGVLVDCPTVLLSQEGSDYVVTIPAKSVQPDRVLNIGTNQNQKGEEASLAASWSDQDGEALCVTLSMPDVPAAPQN